MRRVSDALTPHPHRGPLIAGGAVPLALAIIVIDGRMADAWSDGVRLAVCLAAAVLVFAMALATPLERDDGPRGFHVALLLSGLALVTLALARLATVLGAHGEWGHAGAETWTLLVLAGTASVAATRSRSAVCGLIGAIAVGGALLAFCDWLFHIHAYQPYRWLLLLLAVFFSLWSLALRQRRPGHAAQLVNAAGLAIVGLGLTLLAPQLGVRGLHCAGSECSAVTFPWGWELLLLVAGFGLIAYAASEHRSGPAYLGVLSLVIFAATESLSRDPGGSLAWWPLALLFLGAIGLGFGLRPIAPLPPPPDAAAPAAPAVSLPTAYRVEPDDERRPPRGDAP